MRKENNAVLLLKRELRGNKEDDLEYEDGLMKLSAGLNSRQVEFEIEKIKDVEVFIETNNIKAVVSGKNVEDYKVVFVRSMRLSDSTMLSIVANLVLRAGKVFIDCFHKDFRKYGKIRQMFLLALDGVPVPKTYFAKEYTEEKIDNAIKFLDFPVIVKDSYLNKGKGVFMAKSKEEIYDLLKSNRGEEIFLQQFIDNDFDFRLLVLGDKVAVAEKRIRQDKENEFKNNISAGGVEEFIQPKEVSQEHQKIAVKSAEILQLQVAGVDLVIGKDRRPYIFEVNRGPQFTLDEDISNETDALAGYLTNIVKK